jgi:DNA-binding transcriptional regulator YiaG
MPNIATALKEEMSRIARKELRAETDALRKTVAGHRREIAALKKRLQSLERQSKSRTKKTAPPAHGSEDQAGRQLRFSATRVAAQRKKLGLSAANFAALLGVAPISVYNWEGGKARPRRAQLEAIAAARKLGKKESLERLEELGRGVRNRR